MQEVEFQDFFLNLPHYVEKGHSAEMVTDKLFVENSEGFRLVVDFFLCSSKIVGDIEVFSESVQKI